MSQCFRIRFILSGPTRISSPEKQMVLAERAADGEDVVLRGLGESIIQDSAQLVVEGRDYRSEDEARAAGDRWRGLLEKAFAAVNLGADFGDRADQRADRRRRAVLRRAAGSAGPKRRPWCGDLRVRAGPRFVSVGLTLSVGRSAENLARAIARAREIGTSMSRTERLAYDLYSASFALPAADAIRDVDDGCGDID
jgi:hypothetical protein